MSHELGHNFSRPHAPCGGVANPDPNYPYAGGVLSATPLMDSVPAAIDIISPPRIQTDIMGYCNGSWFSDYNYREMQRYMESQSGLIAAQIAADVVEQDLLLIAGTIGLDGLTLAPVQALRGVPSTAGGEYTLRLTLSDGTTIEHAIEAELVDHAVPPERHFAVAVPRACERHRAHRGAARRRRDRRALVRPRHSATRGRIERQPRAANRLERTWWSADRAMGRQRGAQPVGDLRGQWCTDRARIPANGWRCSDRREPACRPVDATSLQ